jgi:hypothetical protein
VGEKQSPSEAKTQLNHGNFMLPFLTFGNFMLLKEKNDQKGPLQEYSKIKGSGFCYGKFMVPMTAKIWVKSQYQ